MSQPTLSLIAAAAHHQMDLKTTLMAWRSNGDADADAGQTKRSDMGGDRIRGGLH